MPQPRMKKETKKQEAAIREIEKRERNNAKALLRYYYAKDPLKALGITNEDTIVTAKKKYRLLQMMFHPDRRALHNDPDSTEISNYINSAWEIAERTLMKRKPINGNN